MAKNLTIACIALFVALSSSVAFAATWSGNANLVSIEALTDTAFANGTSSYLSFSATPSGKPSCGTSTQGVFSGSVDNVKAMTSIALAALLAGRTVKVRWAGDCYGTYAKIDALQMF